MKKKDRKKYSIEHIAMEQRLENRYTSGMTKLLRNQVRKFRNAYKNNQRAAIADLQKQIYDPAVTIFLKKMYLKAAVEFGTAHYVNSLAMAATPRKKESAAFGFSEEWAFAIIDFLNQYLLDRAVIRISETTKKLVMDALEEGQEQGWSVERIYQELKHVEELSPVRARRIIRTELGIANNFGSNLAENELEFETVTEWITARDKRVRHSHQLMDGVTVPTGSDFTVPIYKGKTPIGHEPMNGPGDPKASAGNVINCRCTRAAVPKRDADGNLIMKPKKVLSTANNINNYV